MKTENLLNTKMKITKAKFNLKYIYSIILVLIILISIYFTDIPLANFIKNNIDNNTIKIFQKITLFGSFLYIAIINTIILLYLFIKQHFIKNNNDKTIILMLYAIISQSITAILVQLLKFIFGRIRPFYFIDNIKDTSTFTFFNYHDNFVSFPSGYSAGIWALITCLLIVFKDNKYSKLLIIPGFLISISRLILNVHFLSDILFGSIFGIVISRIILLKLINQLNK